MNREYKHDIDEPLFGDLYTVEEFKEAVNTGWITNWDGFGFWCKDGKESNDEVFSTPQLDATHVTWFNK